MTLTLELHLDSMKMKQHATYLGKRSFRSKVIARRHREIHRDWHTRSRKVCVDSWLVYHTRRPNCQKDDKFRYFIPILRTLGAA